MNAFKPAFRPAIRPAITSVFGVYGGVAPMISFILSHGQSLSIGDQGFPLTHTIETFGSNVRQFNNLESIGPGFEVELLDADIANLIPYKEKSKETHAWSMLNWLNADTSLDNYAYASCGVGGKTIAELTEVRPTQKWGWFNVSKVISRIKQESNFSIPFITWIHGEADSLNPVASAYKTDLREYHDRVKSETGKNPPMLMDQTGKNSSVDIAEILLQYSEENADCYLAGPKYWLNRLYPETTGLRLHLNANGYMLQGEMIGECAKQVLAGNNFKALTPISVSIVPGSAYKKVKVDFNVPHGGNIVIDTVTLPAAPSLGFGLRYYAGFSSINALSYVVNGNSIEFTFAEPVATDSVVNLGNTLDDRISTDNVLLPCTNIRSSVGHSSLAVAGATWYDWAVQFKRTPTGALNRVSGNLWIHPDFTGTIGAGEVVQGRTTEWLLLDRTDVRVSCTVSGTSGTAWLWVYNTRIILVNGFNDVVIPFSATKRMYLQGASSGFIGSVSGISISQL
ncbi:hypothetical protein ACRWQN_17575 [Shewanella sp. HL-SH8]|uniref:hypothetical protein n=1 Tax=Shewanella sp. HL-SH8 TaxID=3436242 RepID=UPI003EBB4B96